MMSKPCSEHGVVGYYYILGELLQSMTIIRTPMIETIFSEKRYQLQYFQKEKIITTVFLLKNNIEIVLAFTYLLACSKISFDINYNAFYNICNLITQNDAEICKRYLSSYPIKQEIIGMFGSTVHRPYLPTF